MSDSPAIDFDALEAASCAAERSLDHAADLAHGFPGVAESILASLDPRDVRTLLAYARRGIAEHRLNEKLADAWAAKEEAVSDAWSRAEAAMARSNALIARIDAENERYQRIGK